MFRKILRSSFDFFILKSLNYGELRLRRIFLHSTPDKRACRSSSAECEPLFALKCEGARHRRAHQNKKRGVKPLFWVPLGSSFLNFAQHLGLNFMKCFAKFFGHRSQNNSLGCFAHCVRPPHGSTSIKIKDRRTYVRLSFILVDPRGVEPLSENLLI